MTDIKRANEHNVRKQISGALTDAEASIATLVSRADALEANAGYALFVQTPEFDPSDSTNHFFGALPLPPSTTGGERSIKIPRAGTITRVDVLTYAKTAGGADAWSLYVRLNDTTDTLVATVSSATNLRTFSGSGLAIAVSAGDLIEMKLVSPAWASNPAGVYAAGHVFVK